MIHSLNLPAGCMLILVQSETNSLHDVFSMCMSELQAFFMNAFQSSGFQSTHLSINCESFGVVFSIKNLD